MTCKQMLMGGGKNTITFPKSFLFIILLFTSSLVEAQTTEEIQYTGYEILSDNVYDHLSYNRFFECFNRNVVGITACLRKKKDTEVYVVDGLTKESEKICIIPKDSIEPDKETYYSIPETYLQPNQYIAINGNLFYGRTSDKLSVCGAEFIQDDGAWSQIIENLLFSYNIHYYNPKDNWENFAGSTFSIMTNSIGTDNYVSRLDRHYIRRMESTIGLDLYQRVNKGGATVMKGINTDENYLTRDDRMRSLYSNGNKGECPDYIFITGGINDFLCYDGNNVFDHYPEIGEYNYDYENLSNTSSFIEAYEYLVYNLKYIYPTSRIVCVTPMKTYVNWITHDPFINKNNINLEEFADAIKLVAERMDCDIIDLYKEFPINANNKHLLTQDLLHPTDAGYAIIENSFLNFFKSINNTAIHEVSTDSLSKSIFNLHGVRVNSCTHGNIYIINGKKIYIK